MTLSNLIMNNTLATQCAGSLTSSLPLAIGVVLIDIAFLAFAVFIGYYIATRKKDKK